MKSMNMEKWLQLNNQVAGRDKIARLMQYSSRALWDVLDKTEVSPAVVDSLKTIEYILSTFRKLLRFGKCLEVFYTSLHTIHCPDLVVRVTLTFGKLSQSLFLLSDHLMWLARTGLFPSINTKKWGIFANKYWLLSLIMNLCRDVYEIYRVLDLHKATKKSDISRISMYQFQIKSASDLCVHALRYYSVILSHKAITVDAVKNICDFFIPFTALGYTNLSPRSVGVLGTLSSIAGLLVLIDPTARLVPM